jgi:glycyl-tRNA synthetase
VLGTPLCVTVDFQSLEDQAVTIRERDSMAQIRVPIADLVPALREKLENWKR